MFGLGLYVLIVASLYCFRSNLKWSSFQVDHFVLERRSGTVRATNHGADGHDRDDPLVKISAERIEEARAQYDKLKMPA
jgi:hypothetical protein